MLTLHVKRMIDMKKKNDLLIIIPAYNEEKTIGAVLEKLTEPAIADYADVLVMNDCSSDKTEEVVRRYPVFIVNHVYNLGYGCGLQVGYKYAVSKGYKYVIQMDADGQHDVSNIRVIFDRLSTPRADGTLPDIVLGSRFLKDSPKYPTSSVKKFAYKLFSGMIRIGAGNRIADATTGLQGLNYRAFSFYAGYNHFDDKYPDANMIMQMSLLGYDIEEIPALMHERTEGVSMHSGLKPFVYMLRMTLSIFAVYIRMKMYYKVKKPKKKEKKNA